MLFELYVSRCCVGSFAGFGLVANCEGIVVDIIATAGSCGGFGIRKLADRLAVRSPHPHLPDPIWKKHAADRSQKFLDQIILDSFHERLKREGPVNVGVDDQSISIHGVGPSN